MPYITVRKFSGRSPLISHPIFVLDDFCLKAKTYFNNISRIRQSDKAEMLKTIRMNVQYYERLFKSCKMLCKNIKFGAV